jgi:hypothetical protein
MMNIGRLFSGRRLAGAAAALGLMAAGAVGAVSLSSAAADTPAVAAAPTVGINQVAPGSGTLFFDFGCDGTYSSAPITFNADGTFVTGTLVGVWVRIGGTTAGDQAGMITFQFTNSPLTTTYSSVTTASVATGIQATFQGLDGCHFITEAGTPTAARRLSDDNHNADGSSVK